MDERKLRLYKFLLAQHKLTLEQIPEPYKTALTEVDLGL